MTQLLNLKAKRLDFSFAILMYDILQKPMCGQVRGIFQGILNNEEQVEVAHFGVYL